MSSLTRMLSILDLFTVERSYLTGEEIIEATGLTRPTAYRYLKELRRSRLIARFAGGYVLGARVMLLDYIIRQSDPMQRLFQPIIARLRDRIDCDIILASLLGDDFLAIVHEETGKIDGHWPRGRPMPLTRGAGALAMLSILPLAELRRLLARAAADVAAEPLLDEIRAVGRQGYAVSQGAVRPQNVGIAIPLALEGLAPASLTLVMTHRRFLTSDLGAILQMANEAKAEMAAAYAQIRAEHDWGDGAD